MGWAGQGSRQQQKGSGQDGAHRGALLSPRHGAGPAVLLPPSPCPECGARRSAAAESAPPCTVPLLASRACHVPVLGALSSLIPYSILAPYTSHRAALVCVLFPLPC